MKSSTKKGKKTNAQKWILTFMIGTLLSFHVPQAFAENDPYSIPANWPSHWVAPFANENKTEVAIATAVTPQRTVKYTKTVVATAYSSEVRQTDGSPFSPAMRMDFRDVVAQKGEVNCIAHNDLRLGTEVRFPEMFGDKVYVVCDRMNVRYTGKNRIDFYFYVIGEDGKIDSKESLAAAKANARMFGVKKGIKMEILEPSV